MQREDTGATDLLDGLRRRWRVAVLVALPLLTGVVLYVENLPDRFAATSVVSFTPRADADIGGDLIRITLPKYVAYLSSRPTAGEVAADLGLNESALRNGIDASIAPETANLEVTVEFGSSDGAARAAAALADAAVDLSKTDQLLSADVVVPAVEVAKPVGPPRRLLEVGGLALALLAGLTAALVVDRNQPRVSTTEDLARVTGHRVLGWLPRSRALRQPPSQALLDATIGAAVGALVIQLDSESRIQPIRALAVTSPSSGDGKTTAAAALATGLARLDARVLLVDADLRRPRLGQQLGLQPASDGLAAVLEGGMSLSEAVVPHTPATLSVLLTRGRDDAGNLLARRLEAVLAQARDQYDIVVVDCPPVLATDDALIITVTCDATVLVVGRGTRVEQTAMASSALAGLNVRVVGAVLNRAAGRSGTPYAYGTYGQS